MPSQRKKAEFQPRWPIVLVGFMAAGKSRIGRILAQRLNLPFVDTDRTIEKSYNISVAQIFEERGEAEFRIAERALISQLLCEGAQIIAVGGGAFVDPATRDELKRKALTIWLDVPLGLVLDRLARSSTRPLATNKSESEIKALWEERRRYYAEAEVRIDVSQPNQTRIIAQILGKLRQGAQRQDFAQRGG